MLDKGQSKNKDGGCFIYLCRNNGVEFGACAVSFFFPCSSILLVQPCFLFVFTNLDVYLFRIQLA